MALGLSIGVVDKDVAAVAPLADCFVVLQKGRVAWVGGGASLSADAGLLHGMLGVRRGRKGVPI